MLGRIGRFWAIGPREYGGHTVNPMLKLMNQWYLAGLSQMLHRPSVMKSLSHRGYNAMRPMKFVGIVFPFCCAWSLFFNPFYDKDIDPIDIDENETMRAFMRKANAPQLGTGCMNDRTSAHYLEINRIYSAEMLRRVIFSNND